MSEEKEIPFAVTFFGFLIALPLTYMNGRLLWEETVLTWISGEKVISFATAHNTWGLFLGIGSLLGLVWLLIAVIYIVRYKTFGRRAFISIVVAIGLCWGHLFIA